MDQIVTARLAPHYRDHSECAEQRDRVDRGVKQCRREAFLPASDEAEQRVAGMRNGRVGEQAAHVCLHESDEVSEKLLLVRRELFEIRDLLSASH